MQKHRNYFLVQKLLVEHFLLNVLFESLDFNWCSTGSLKVVDQPVSPSNSSYIVCSLHCVRSIYCTFLPTGSCSSLYSVSVQIEWFHGSWHLRKKINSILLRYGCYIAMFLIRSSLLYFITSLRLHTLYVQ